MQHLVVLSALPPLNQTDSTFVWSIRGSGQCPVSRVSLTRSAVARAFSDAHDSNRAHLFVGARTASIFGVAVHLRHPNLLGPLRSSIGVAHQSSLRSSTTTMSFSISPFREAGSLINQPVTF